MFAIEVLSALLNLSFVVVLGLRIRWAWVLGFFGSALAVILLFDSKLYAESLLNLSYALLAVFGWFSWGRPESASEPIISRPLALLLTLILAISLAWLMVRHTDNPRPFASPTRPMELAPLAGTQRHWDLALCRPRFMGLRHLQRTNGWTGLLGLDSLGVRSQSFKSHREIACQLSGAIP